MGTINMFCLGLFYVKGGAIRGHNKHVLSVKTKCQAPSFHSINPFSSSATNISVYHVLSGFGGLVVSMLASGTQDRGFKPGRSCRIFQAKKSLARLPSEGK